uniref:Uncharacterized protein n=1 Tax=Sphaerodactylus townsendi TaxID=933632 RepID=A0ACB8G2E1_9SAUR
MITTDKHFKRVRALLDCGQVAIGGETDECDRYIAPTVLADVKEWEPIMQQEVFGPVLPILTVSCLDEAIHFINYRDRPLIVFAFSCKSEIVKQVLDCTSSGGFCGNNDLNPIAFVTLPSGGIGCSGFGKYRGKFSFDTFTNQRGCNLRVLCFEEFNCVRYPPYTERKLRLLEFGAAVWRWKLCTLL